MDVRPLSVALQKKARDEINEDPQRVPSDLKAIRDWLQEQPQLRSIPMSDQWLMAFLRGTKYNLDKCKSKLEHYYTLREMVPEFYTKRDPLDPGMQELLKLGVFLPLRKCAREDSPRICISRIGVLCKAKRSFVDFLKLAFMFIEILLIEDDNFTVAGEDVISDAKDISLAYMLSQWTPSLARKSFICAEKALTVRMKTLCVVNAPRGLKTVVNVFKMFMGIKLKNRVRIFNEKYEDMFDIIPESVLPVEYGGSDGSLEELAEYWKAKVESYRDWFLQQEEETSADVNASSEEHNHPSDLSTNYHVEDLSVLQPSKKLEID